MDKEEKEYLDKYSDIPNNYEDRIKVLLGGNYSKYRGIIIETAKNIMNIKWKHIHIIAYIVPKATPRPRYSGRTKIFYVKNASNNRKRFKKFMEREQIEQIYTPMKFTCVSYLPIPSSMNKLEKLLAEMGLIRPVSKPDWDNLGKTYSDMIQEQLILDDSLIIEGISKKFYSLKPRVEISISYMSEFDSQYNKNKILSIKERNEKP